MPDFKRRFAALTGLGSWQRANLQIVIFGGYEPEKCFERLLKLRDGFFDRGWRHVVLVADIFPKAEEDVYQKILRALNESDVNLLVFLEGCSQGGVTVEATEVLNDIRLIEKSVMLVEANLTKTFISEVVEGRDEFRRTYHREIKVGDDRDLIEHALGSILATIARRPPLGYFKTQ